MTAPRWPRSRWLFIALLLAMPGFALSETPELELSAFSGSGPCQQAESEAIDFDFAKQSAVEFIDFLIEAHEQECAPGGQCYLTFHCARRNWIRESDIPALLDMLDSREPCISIASFLMPESLADLASTAGREASMLIDGFRTGLYPPAHLSPRVDPDLSRYEAWWNEHRTEEEGFGPQRPGRPPENPGIVPGADEVAGTYRSCAMACTTLTLSEDGRFEKKFTGDLFAGERSEGTWMVQPDGVLLLNSDAQPSVELSRDPSTTDLLIDVVDTSGAPLRLARVGVSCLNGEQSWWFRWGDEGLGSWYQESETVDLSTPLGPLRVPGCKATRIEVDDGSMLSHAIDTSKIDENVFRFVLDTRVQFFETNEPYLWMPGFVFFQLKNEGQEHWSPFPLELIQE